jgi:hypothetical protein
MSPSSTTSSTEQNERTSARRGPLVRKLAICAAALIVTVLPTACDAAYAGSTTETDHSGHNGPQNLFPVGGTTDTKDGKSSGSDQPNDTSSDNGSGDNGGGSTNGGSTNGDSKNGGSTNGGSDNADAKPDDSTKPAADTGGGNNNDNKDNKDAGNKGNGGGNGNAGAGAGANNGLDVLGTDCSNSDLQPHTGFQEAPRCVETSFGEVASEDKSPSLLITDSPDTVKAGDGFTLAVSTRNLVRDRFLGAAAGGYYLESSFLNADGIQRGHFHTACRMLDNLDAAPDAAPDPEFFLATQDNGGGAGADTVTVTVTGMPRAGTAQCSVWAGDGSHRIPMMQRANQTPAFDAVRITVQ